MNQPKDLLNIDTMTPSWNYSSLQILKYLHNQKEVWNREELDLFFEELMSGSFDSSKIIQSIYRNQVPGHILANIIDNTKTLLFTK